MGRLKDLIQENPVHERRLELRTYPLEDDRVLVEGWLRDERFVPGYSWGGKTRSPGVIHWMCVRLLVGGRPLTILDAEADMPDVPHELCTTTLDSVKKVVGLPIVPGFTEKVRELLGGVQGCAHLTQLIMTMGPAALHGYWTQTSRRRPRAPTPEEASEALSYLVNSCRLWAENGPMIQKRRSTLEKQTNPPDH
jgi:hypothetical protein